MSHPTDAELAAAIRRGIADGSIIEAAADGFPPRAKDFTPAPHAVRTVARRGTA